MTTLADLTTRLGTGGTADADAVLALRRQVWPDGRVDAAEADMIFALNDAMIAPTPEWSDFFVEAITGIVVHQQAPRGYVDDAGADWLLMRVAADGRVGSLTELELLVRVLETATNAPARLKAAALDAIADAVLTGEGPTRRGDPLDPGCISAGEVALLRRALFAQAGDGAIKVSREEADLLFRLKDATLGADNASDWPRLFVQGVGNHLMAHASYTPLERADAARLDAFMDDARGSVLGFLRRVVTSNPLSGVAALRAERAPGTDHAAAVAADRAITPVEADWVNAAMAADGTLDPLERALIAFVAEESGTTLTPRI